MATGIQYRTANKRALDDSLFPPVINFFGQAYERMPKRYGDNPHQACCFYVPTGRLANIEDVDAVIPGHWFKRARPEFLVVGGLKERKSGKEGLSATNTRDVGRACRTLKYLNGTRACAVMKHLNPSGVAWDSAKPRSLAECFNDAWLGDPTAAFGGVAVFTRPVDMETAHLIQDGRHYIEVVAAPGFEQGVVGVFERTYLTGGSGQKKVNPSLRAVEIRNLEKLPRFVGDEFNMEVITMEDGTLIVQEPYLTRVKTMSDMEVMSEVDHLTTLEDTDNAFLAWYVTQGLRSNAVGITKDGQLIASGTGQQERVRSVRYALKLAEDKEQERAKAVRDALERAEENGHCLEGSTLASDGFIPFRDSIDECAAKGVRTVIEPGESTRDEEVIAAANEHGMTLAFTGERCFAHF